MRSQTSKTVPKKGPTKVKAGSPTKQAKQKTPSPKKVKTLVKKSLVKSPKKAAKDDSSNKADEEAASASNNTPSESSKSGPSKGTTSRSNSPTKKAKKDPKERKDPVKSPPGVKKVLTKKIIRKIKKTKLAAKEGDDSDDIKYKLNVDASKKVLSKFSKTKTIIKKSNQKKNIPPKKQEKGAQEKCVSGAEQKSESDNKAESNQSCTKTDIEKTIREINDKKEESKPEFNKPNIETSTSSDINAGSSNLQTQKVETERPPKFFTSSRSSRMVDIDVKFCKTSKGTMSVSERFISMKCDPKPDDSNKDKNVINTFVSQGPEADVYTFTDKVDSPKSILSDFRNPINKNIGRVRPIARVKGTVIDKKDPERKKYSPHRPIEEVVKQLKANKRSEDFSVPNQYQDTQSATSTESSTINSEKDSDEKPKPIVSKSYKMVARKSSITGKPFSPIKFLDQEPASKSESISSSPKKKSLTKTKKQQRTSLSDDEFDTAKFALNKKSFQYSSSDESVSESNDDDTKESSGSDAPKNQKRRNKKYKKITDSAKKNTSKELRELSKDSLVDLKDDTILGGEKPSKRRLKLLSMWSGPKKHRMASLNALAKVHCLYENESRTHMELGLMKTIDRLPMPSTSKASATKKKEPKPKEPQKPETSTSESEYENKNDKKDDSSDSSDENPPQRTLRGVPGIRSAGKYWDPKSSTSSSEDSEMEFQKTTPEKKKASSKTTQAKSSDKVSDTEKPPAKMKKTAGVPVKKKRNRSEVVMDLKDMVVQKRMASLNATAILAASYEKRSPRSNKEDTTSDSCSDESFSQKSKNGVSSGVKSEVKHEDTKKESDDTVLTDSKQKVEVIVNQDTDVTITGVYSTHHHEGFCTVSGMQYRISSTSHTQTTATANCEKEGCSRDDARYTPLSALSSMQPPADAHNHPHPVPELGGLARRAGCSSAFSAPSPSAHHEPGKPVASACSVCESASLYATHGYYQPAGPMIKETGADAERALARYHPPHYHAPHPPVLQQYGPYYPPELCYGRYYRPPGPPYHMPPQPDAQMVGVGSEPYPPPQYYGTPPCYQHSPQRIPYVEYRGCPCPLNACPKNVLIGLATGKAPTGVGPDALPARAPPSGLYRPKLRACVLENTDNHGSGKDPPLEPEPPAAADAPHPCPLPAIGGASPKRELYDVRDKIRLVGDLPGPAEALGPPSPARGSAGACAPQPPPVAPRRARLGKEAARKSLADTGQYISAPPQPPPAHTSDADDDVMAVSPPSCAPIDLSSSDERTTPLVDVKKENEGPTCAASRKNDAPALREQNTTVTVQETTTTPENTEPKAVKRRYSRPKLEIDMNNIQLEESCKTNGIGEHVKLQKRRKVSGEQTNTPRVEPVAKEPKKKTQTKRTPRTPNSEKKPAKRKLDNANGQPKAKRMLLATPVADEARLKDVTVTDNDLKPKTKSALLLDNLLRKNSIDRDITLDEKLNPAELFLTPDESVSPKESKKTLNINNNIVENAVAVCGVRPNTIAAVTQLIEKKLACKKLEKVDSKITHSLKSVLKPPTDKLKLTETPMLSSNKCKAKSEKNILSESSDIKAIEVNKNNCESLNDNLKDSSSVSNKISAAAEDDSKSAKVSKATKTKAGLNKIEDTTKLADESHISLNKTAVDNSTDMTSVSECDNKNSDTSDPSKTKRSKLTSNKATGQTRNKSIEKVAKLLGAKKPVATENLNDLNIEKKDATKEVDILASKIAENTTRPVIKRNKANGEIKTKSIEKVTELLGANKVAEEKGSAEDKEKRLSPENLETKTHPEKTLPKRCKLNGELKEEKKKKVEKVVKLLVSKKPAIKTDEAMEVVEDACASPLPTVGRRTKRRRSGALTRRPRRPLAPLAPPAEHRGPPRWSNGWHWDGDHYVNKVYLNNDCRLDRTARCWPRMCHQSGDSVARGDCVLLRASAGRAQQPFVARVASLWENPEDGEMMVSLVWYYRPEHTERGRAPADAPDEVFASRHRDANSVACIEDKCYVLTFNEYCRYRKRLKAAEEGITIQPSIVPPLPASEVTPAVQPTDTKLPKGVAPDLVLFCRKIYDFRSKKIQLPNK